MDCAMLKRSREPRNHANCGARITWHLTASRRSADVTRTTNQNVPSISCSLRLRAWGSSRAKTRLHWQNEGMNVAGSRNVTYFFRSSFNTSAWLYARTCNWVLFKGATLNYKNRFRTSVKCTVNNGQTLRVRAHVWPRLALIDITEKYLLWVNKA